MVTKFGMSELGPINLDPERNFYEPSEVSPDMSAKIDAQVKRITDDAYTQAIGVLTSLRDKLDTLAKELLKKETIEAEDFVKLIGPKKALATAEAKRG
jgi:cell division protease FtsH